MLDEYAGPGSLPLTRFARFAQGAPIVSVTIAPFLNCQSVESALIRGNSNRSAPSCPTCCQSICATSHLPWSTIISLNCAIGCPISSSLRTPRIVRRARGKTPTNCSPSLAQITMTSSRTNIRAHTLSRAWDWKTLCARPARRNSAFQSSLSNLNADRPSETEITSGRA